MIRNHDSPCLWLAGLFLLSVGPALGAASVPEGPQEDAVIAIRELYARTGEAIRQAVANTSLENQELYCNEVVLNRYDGPWRAVGNFSRRESYWYNDQPEFARSDDRPGESVLVKVEIKETAAVSTVSEEYLFDEGKLVFYYCREKDGDSAPREERLYFQAGKTIRRLGDPKGEGYEPSDPIKVLARAAGLQKFFLSFFD